MPYWNIQQHCTECTNQSLHQWSLQSNVPIRFTHRQPTCLCVFGETGVYGGNLHRHWGEHTHSLQIVSCSVGLGCPGPTGGCLLRGPPSLSTILVSSLHLILPSQNALLFFLFFSHLGVAEEHLTPSSEWAKVGCQGTLFFLLPWLESNLRPQQDKVAMRPTMVPMKNIISQHRITAFHIIIGISRDSITQAC